MMSGIAILRRAVLPLLTLCVVVSCGSALCLASDYPLADLTPADAGIYFQADNAAQHAQEFLSGPLGERLKNFGPFKAWAAGNLPQLKRTIDKVGSHLGLDPGELWQGVLGHQAALAVWPPQSEGEKERVLAIVSAKDDELLHRAVAGFVRAQAEFDSVQWKDAAYNGLAYQTGFNPKKEQPIHIAELGDVAVIASSEEVLHRVLDLHAASAAADPQRQARLSDLPAFTAAMDRLPSEALLKVFVHPQPWQAALQRDAADAHEDKRAEKLAFVEMWKAMRSCTAAVQFGQRISAEGYLDFDDEQLPGPAREALAGLRGEEDFFRHVPADCLLAVAGRVDVHRLWMIANPAPQDASSTTRGGGALWSFFNGVLRLLDADMGGFVTSGSGELPVDIVAGMKLRPTPASGETPNPPQTEELLGAALPPLLSFLVAASGSPEAKVATTQQDGLSLTSVKDWKALPPGVEASYTIADGYLLSGTSASAVRASATLDEDQSLAGSRHFQQQLNPRIPSPGHVLYINAAAIRRLIQERPEELAVQVAQLRKLDEETAQRALSQLHDVLQLADTLTFTGKVEPKRVSLSIALTAE